MIRFLRDYITPYVDEVEVDNLGNVIGILQGRTQLECRLMLQAHMDELGLIVRNITLDGYLLFERVGGVPEKSLPGQRVDVLTDVGDLIPGYVGTKSHHITKPEEKFIVPPIHKMYIDVGLPNREAVQSAGIQVGDPIAYYPKFHHFGDGQICSKALDNRACVYVLLRVLEQLAESRPPCSVVFSFTVLEEFSIRGSLPTVTRTDPRAIISFDVTIATDTPSDDQLHPVVLNGGPAIKMMDFHGRGTLGGMFSSPPLRRFIEAVAREENLPLQREVIVGVITEPAFQLYLGEKGYTIAALSLPQRYSHSAISMCHENDIRQMIDLVTAIAQQFDTSIGLTRG
jgi:putative aminopeptidase FrvX